MVSWTAVKRILSFGAILSLSSSALALETLSKPAELLKQGKKSMEKGDLLIAIEMLEEALKINVGDENISHPLIDAYINQGRVLGAAGDLSRESTFLDKALDLKPIESTELDALQGAWEELVSRDPKNAFYHIGLGRCLNLRGDRGGAKAEGERAWKLARDNSLAMEKLNQLRKEYSNSARRTLNIERSLDDVFLYPDGHNKFNSKLWKSDPTTRLSMVFDLYHRPLKDMTINQVYEILGLPDKIEKDQQNSEIARYYLGRRDDVMTALLIRIVKWRPSSMKLEQKTSSGYYVSSAWYLKNIDWNGLSSAYNQKYMLVGMPVSVIPQVVHNAFEKSLKSDDNCEIHCFGPFQFQYTQDRKTIRKFRIEYKTATGTRGFTKWEEQNLRFDPRCLASAFDYAMLDSIYYHCKSNKFIDFSSAYCKADWVHDIRNRPNMLTSLLRSYPIIGMSRSEIEALIGVSETEMFRIHQGLDRSHQDPRSDPNADFKDTERYTLFASRCGNAPSSSFEIAYKDDRVCGYRVTESGGDRCSSLTSQEFECK